MIRALNLAKDWFSNKPRSHSEATGAAEAMANEIVNLFDKSIQEINNNVDLVDFKAIFTAPNAINFGAGKMKTPRKHADLIKQWADDDSLVIEIKLGTNWIFHDRPVFDNGCEYRIKPTKPSIDWSHVADEYNWLAVDSNGSCHMFTERPDLGGALWKTGSERKTIPVCFFKSFKPGTCDWKDSLVQRPEGE